MNDLQIQTRNDEISINRLLNRIKTVFVFIKKRLIRIISIGVLFGVIGFLASIFTPVRYISKVTFVIEESKSSGSGLSVLAGQFGFDLGGGMGAGVFSNDNIILFLKSESLCRDVMLTSYNDLGTVSLADRYAEIKNFKSRWRKKLNLRQIDFSKYSNKVIPRTEDSLLQILIRDNLLKHDLYISKPDKKATFIQVVVSSEDEKFSSLFSKRLVGLASSRYVESKIKLKLSNVRMLQNRADSLGELLNYKTIRAASNQQVLVDANPAIKLAPAAAEISMREKTMIGTIFAEVVKNLEIAKSILNQETPAIQIVDESSLPLEQIKVNKIKSFFIWFAISGLLYISILLFKNWIRTNKI